LSLICILRLHPFFLILRLHRNNKGTPAKDIATAFHVGLKQFRAASWAKLPPLWYINRLAYQGLPSEKERASHKKHGNHSNLSSSLLSLNGPYDYVWYIDSDAVISPFARHRTIPEIFQLWNENPTSFLLPYGSQNLTETSILFFNNFPWRDDIPCAGSFLFKPTIYMDAIFREWWDYNLMSKNFKHFHEQDALWHMIEAEKDRKNTGKPPFLINSKTFAIATEHQFPSAWKRYEDLWLVHIASYNYALRMPILYQFLHIIGKDSNEAFYLAISHLQQYHILFLKPLTICEEMETVSSLPVAITTTATSSSSTVNPSTTVSPVSLKLLEGRERITDFPLHNTLTEKESFYETHVTSTTLPTIPLSELYEGRIIRRKGEFWIVNQGKKLGFMNWQSFLDYQINIEWAHHLKPVELSQIPSSERLINSSATSSSLEKQRLLKYYQPLTTMITAKKRSKGGEGAATAGEGRNHSSLVTIIQNEGYSSYLYYPLSASSASTATPVSSVKPVARVVFYIISHNNETELLVQQYLQSCCLPVSSLSSSASASSTTSVVSPSSSLVDSSDSSSSSSSSSSSNSLVLQDDFHWIISQQITSSVFFESIIYQTIFSQQQSIWEKKEYVITATYKTLTKSLHYNSYSQSLSSVLSLLTIAVEEGYDVIPFLRSGSGELFFLLLVVDVLYFFFSLVAFACFWSVRFFFSFVVLGIFLVSLFLIPLFPCCLSLLRYDVLLFLLAWKRF
jgi:hypothetical protein